MSRLPIRNSFVNSMIWSRTVAGLPAMTIAPSQAGRAAACNFGRLAEARSVIAGSPATVRDQIIEFTKEFRIGNLLVMLQMGGMPHDLTMKNIHLFTRKRCSRISQEQWTDEDWENPWWPAGLAQPAGV